MKTIEFAEENGKRFEQMIALVPDENYDALLSDLCESGRKTKSGLPINRWMLKALRQEYAARFMTPAEYDEYLKQTLGSARPATAKQIAYLRLLGETQLSGLTVAEASALIENRKNRDNANTGEAHSDPVIWNGETYGDAEG